MRLACDNFQIWGCFVVHARFFISNAKLLLKKHLTGIKKRQCIAKIRFYPIFAFTAEIVSVYLNAALPLFRRIRR